MLVRETKIRNERYLVRWQKFMAILRAIVKKRDDKKCKGNFDKIRTKYRDKEIKSELITVIGKFTDSAELMHQGSSQEVNMCTALERLKEKGRKENIRNLVLEWAKDGYSVQEIFRLDRPIIQHECGHLQGIII